MDDHRYRVYVVRCNGSRVVVNDMLATTSFMMGHCAAMPAKTDAASH